MFDTHVQHLLSGEYSLCFLGVDEDTRAHLRNGFPASIGTLQLGLVGELRSSGNHGTITGLPSTLIDTERLVFLRIPFFLFLSLLMILISHFNLFLFRSDFLLLLLYIRSSYLSDNDVSLTIIFTTRASFSRLEGNEKKQMQTTWGAE